MYTFALKDHVRETDWTIERAEYDVMEGKKKVATLELKTAGMQANIHVKRFDYAVTLEIAKAWIAAKDVRPGDLNRPTLVCSIFEKNKMLVQHQTYR